MENTLNKNKLHRENSAYQWCVNIKQNEVIRIFVNYAVQISIKYFVISKFKEILYEHIFQYASMLSIRGDHALLFII